MDPFSLKVPFLKAETVSYLLNRIIYLGETFLELASTDEYIHNSVHPKSKSLWRLNPNVFSMTHSPPSQQLFFFFLGNFSHTLQDYR